MKKFIPDLHGWALDSAGKPIPVGMAIGHAKGYTCPLCGGNMRVRTRQNKHYFYHESADDCRPEQVADAVGGVWLMAVLNDLITAHNPCSVSWEVEEQKYTSDLLQGVTTAVENLRTQHGTPDIALIKGENNLHAAIFWRRLEDELFFPFCYEGIPVVIIQSEPFYSGLINPHFVFKAADIWGGWWLSQFPASLVLKPQQLRDLLRQMVANPPFHFCAALETMDAVSCVLSYQSHLLWLPYAVFERIIGGTRNVIGDITIVKQIWHEKDRTEIDLFHVTRHKRDGSKECAVGIRRNFPHVFQAQRSTISVQ
ncbi:MAG: hypothetical protein K8I82_17215, partial [Anaerolineae bacterium]|nr:hypothetical protein [Anaerolineae bacterium]